MLEMETILHTCLEFISNNTNIFKKLLASSTAHISRASVKQYWHFERVTGKQYCKRFQISYHYKIILTFSKSYYQIIVAYSEVMSSSIHTFTELLPNNFKHFFEIFEWTLEQTKNSQTENSQVKVGKVSIDT